ncbi:hypothetical protein MWU63_19890 [Pseudohalocynthiibacter sp. F2068]|jgi:hypothetical protein|nr:hypothetical protein [Pseudohalocynthiibacter sp. F2068]
MGFKAALILALSVLGVTQANGREVDNKHMQSCDLSDECPIPYVRLAGIETTPFLWRGQVLPDTSQYPKSRATIRRYRRALARFPDVLRCLNPNERQKDAPDLRNIDWRRIGSKEQVEVCMFWVFSSYGNLERSLLWFEAQGMSNVRNRQIRVRIDFTSNERRDLTVTQAGNIVGETGRVFGTFGERGTLFSRLLFHGESFSVTRLEDGSIHGTNYEQSAF